MTEFVRSCVETLEGAGFDAYLVGGCVRDALLGLAPHDYDLCTGATPAQTAALFAGFSLDLTGAALGTVRVDDLEITTFRRESAYHDNRHPDAVAFVKDVREDLARRDFTVNAIAWSPSRGYVDPFGGRQDLENRVLRCVGEPEKRFREDALRIARGMRFAARFHLEVEKRTMDAMLRLAPLTDNLARERVFEELTGFLLAADVTSLCRFAPILGQIIPELAPTIGFDQRSPHHAYDLFTHIAHVTQAVSAESAPRWAALLHDIGKVPCFTQDETGRGHFYGHAQVGAKLAQTVLLRLRAPKQLRERAVWLIENHMVRLNPERKMMRRWLCQNGKEAMEQLISLQEADMGGKGTDEHRDSSQFAGLRALLAALEEEEGRMSLKRLAVNGHDLMALGYSGRAVGEELNRLLGLVLDETLPNEKAALLAACPKKKMSL